MRILKIRGGAEIRGSVSIGGNKNAALPMIAALMLTDETVTLRNVPDILDVRTMLDIAGELGAEFEFRDHVLQFRCPEVRTTTISEALCSRNRTSILFAAPLLARCGSAELYPPGGDVIGRRRLDGHFYGLCKLGASMSGERTYRFRTAGRLRGPGSRHRRTARQLRGGFGGLWLHGASSSAAESPGDAAPAGRPVLLLFYYNRPRLSSAGRAVPAANFAR